MIIKFVSPTPKSLSSQQLSGLIKHQRVLAMFPPTFPRKEKHWGMCSAHTGCPGQPHLRHSFEQPRPLPAATVRGLSLTEKPGPHSFSPRPPEPLEPEQRSTAHAVPTLASHPLLPLPGTVSGGGVSSAYLATGSPTKRWERLEECPDPRTRNWSQSLLQTTPPPAARL